MEYLKPGIYFGLDEKIYFRDSALSRSDIMKLLDTPNSYWKNSYLNPGREASSTSPEMEYGSAFDSLLFEPELFKKKYQRVGIDEWDIHKVKISEKDYYKIIDSIKVLRKGVNSTLFLSGGLAQVTIVYEDGGILYRTRHDYFTPVCSSDFKTARTIEESHIKRAFKEYGYDVQLFMYKRARQRVREQLRNGSAGVYGKVDKAFFAKFMAAELNEFIFVIQRKTEPYPYTVLMPEEDTEYSGQTQMLRAAKIYLQNHAQYGDKEWPVCDGKVKPFSMFYGVREDQ